MQYQYYLKCRNSVFDRLYDYLNTKSVLTMNKEDAAMLHYDHPQAAYRS